jgi:2-polyprenyl-3-methyl-5-hydroxy-6-metoxy-1,4-benzoquinol methylase
MAKPRLDEKSGKYIVYKVDGEIPPEDILCSSYQMRNFFHQMADGFFSSLDVMNYIQHYKAVTMMKKGDRVLDVCCGRGLLLPLIRYYAKDIAEYIGVDIAPENIAEQTRKSGIKKIDGLDYYPFTVTHVLGNVAEMSNLVFGMVDFIVYTSAIEHMQKDDGYASLESCYKLLKPGKQMFLSCPNTMDKRDPYDTQYAAHLYEWNLQEIIEALWKVGFKVDAQYGLTMKKRKMDILFANDPVYQLYKEYLPAPFLQAFWPIPYPEQADEVLVLASKPTIQRRRFF